MTCDYAEIHRHEEETDESNESWWEQQKVRKSVLNSNLFLPRHLAGKLFAWNCSTLHILLSGDWKEKFLMEFEFSVCTTNTVWTFLSVYQTFFVKEFNTFGTPFGNNCTTCIAMNATIICFTLLIKLIPIHYIRIVKFLLIHINHFIVHC